MTQTLCSSAQAIKQQAQAGDFAAAEAALSQTEEYFSAHQAGLEVFSQRTGVSSIAVSLAGLRGFLNEENLPDLVSGPTGFVRRYRLRAIYSLLCFERLASSSGSFINVSMSLNWRYTPQSARRRPRRFSSAPLHGKLTDVHAGNFPLV